MIDRGSVSEAEMERRIKADKIDMINMEKIANLVVDTEIYKDDERCHLIFKEYLKNN